MPEKTPTAPASLNSSDKIEKVAAAMVAFQSSLEPIKRDTEGQVGPRKMKYADLATVMEAAKPLLSENKLCVIQTTEVKEEPNKLVLKTVLLHESGQWISSEYLVVCKDWNDPQKLGSGMTYARRYSLMPLLGMVALGEDDDGHAATQKHQNGETKKQPPTGKKLSEKQQKLYDALGKYCEGDVDRMKTVLCEITEWEKDGKKHAGKTSLFDVSDNMAPVALRKLEARIKAEKQNAEATKGEPEKAPETSPDEQIEPFGDPPKEGEEGAPDIF
jgi:hypothetical protein